MKTLDLNGRWSLGWTDGWRGPKSEAYRPEYGERDAISASVPGEIHLDLLAAGLLQPLGDGLHSLAARWVEQCRWHYRRTFVVPDEAVYSPAWLVFDRLDLDAQVYLNEQLVASHANAFHPLRVEVSEHLRAGENTISVHVDSGLYRAGDLPAAGYAHVGGDQELHKRHWLRKPQSQFGWDWAPRVINVGITGDVRLEFGATFAVSQVTPLVDLSPDLDRGHVRVRLHLEGLTAGPVALAVGAEIVGTTASVRADVLVAPGASTVVLELELEQPELWWPAGCGAQRLYELRVAVTSTTGVTTTITREIGFRTIEIDQSPTDSGGRHFVITVNRRPIFAKGANLAPVDLIHDRAAPERYERLVALAVEANFNFLRVWGGGLYEAEVFYDLCDRAGILVWQEFAFSCSWYPGDDKAFCEAVRAEATYQVRRLAGRASLAVWCGNNEVEMASWATAGADHPSQFSDHGIFHELLPAIVAAEDGTRPYLPSSPYTPDGLAPNDDSAGDQHPWAVGFANTDLRDFRRMTCTFADEGGVLGPSSLPTMQRALGDQQWVGSMTWQHHDNAVPWWHTPDPYAGLLRDWVGLDQGELSVEDYVYWAGLLQGEGLREYCENFRRRMFSSAAAVFWMFNDCWPTTRSWAVVDHGLHRTPAFFAVRRALEPVHVMLATTDDDETVHTVGVNDTDAEIAADLRYGIFETTGRMVVDETTPVTLGPNSATRLVGMSREMWAQPDRSAAFAELSQEGRVIARNRLLLVRPAELEWAAPHVGVSVQDGRATFTSDEFVWGVCLDLHDRLGPVDNFFDVYPGIPHTIDWPYDFPPAVVRTANLVTRR